MSSVPGSSLSPTAGSSRSTLSAILKGRRSRKNLSSANSATSADTAGDGSTGSRPGSRQRESVDDDGLTSVASRTSVDDHQSQDSDGNSRFSSLIKKANDKRRRRRRKNEDADSQDGNPDVDTSLNDSLLAADGTLYENGNASDNSLLHHSVASSLLTEDSDPEGPPRRPTLSPHQSHAGYLTLSSPLITAETVDAPSGTDDSSPTVVTEDRLAPRHAKTLDVLPAPRRSPSPVNKLRDAFVPTRKGAAPRPSGDSEPVRPSTSGGGGGGFSGLFGGGKKGSQGGKRGSRTPSEERGPQPSSSPDRPEKPERPTELKRLNTDPPATPPNLTDAPATLVTPPTPTDLRPSTFETPTSYPRTAPSSRTASPINPSIVISPSGNMISHRRARSATNPPSKLSNSISLPLSPTIEEAKTPGGTVVTPTAGGFFSSAFSAIQNATTSLSNTIVNSAGTKGGKGGPGGADQENTGETGGEEVILPSSLENQATEDAGAAKRQLAVETLGSGNLSLSHLGISDSADQNSMGSKTELSESVAYDNASAKAEDSAAAQAVNAAYSSEKTPSTAQDFGERPRSMAGISGTATPPRTSSIGPEPNSVKRSGSIRSRVSGRRRRHRGSSATTGNTIAAAISASTSALASPNTQGNGPRLTGFAVASPKRNRDFHQLFRSVPEDDYLIEDYSAALQRDILLQGRLYVSEGHICFSSNILGWVTNLVISFDEVVSVEKKNTAVIFPNAIVIQTLHARNVFASFVTRDSTYDLLIGIWKISHPNLKSSLNGVTLDAGTGDKTEKAESVNTDEDGSIDEGSDEEVYDEDAEEEEGIGSFMEAGEGSIAGSDPGDIKAVSRKTSAAAVGEKSQNGNAKAVEAVESVVAAATGGNQDFPGPASHAPTECGDTSSHYEKELTDTVIAAPLGKIYSLLFGPASGTFMRKWLVEDQKSLDLQMEDDKQGLGENKKTFSFSYIKPLYGSIGPKQTKCVITQTLEQFDLERAVTVSCSTQTPDVPSGNIFVTKTKYCLMWAPNNSTRLIMNCTIEWSGKSWLKGPIEKGANDGQIQYAKDLIAGLRANLAAKSAPKGAARGKGKGKKKKETSELAAAEDGSPAAVAAQTQQKQSNWGMFEPLHGPLGPVFDILKAIMNMPATVAVLSLLVVYMWLFRSGGASYGTGRISPLGPGLNPQQRVALYEDMWRREENELWRWLEERVSMERALKGGAESQSSLWSKKKVGEDMQQRLKSEEMTERQIDEAIRTTQEKLDVLREAVEKRKSKQKASGTEA